MSQKEGITWEEAVEAELIWKARDTWTTMVGR
jgi:hypothetical protein